MKNTIILITSLILSSCTFFIKADQPTDSASTVVYKKIHADNFCRSPKREKLNAFSKSETSINVFKNILENDPAFKKLNFVEQSIAWSLIQLSTSPHKVSPKSQFQFIINFKGKKEYYYFYTKDKSKVDYPFFNALSFLTKKYKTKSLLSIAKLLDKKLPNLVSVDGYLEQFLKHYRARIKGDTTFKKHFFKSDQVLVSRESYKRVAYRNLVNRYNKDLSKTSHHTNHLFQVKTKSKTIIRCNFDLGLYDNGLYLINPNYENYNNPFSLINENQDTFIGITSLKPRFSALFKNELLFDSSQNDIPASICLIENKEQNKALSLISFKGRDPGQHLHSLLNFNIESVTNENELLQSLKYPRNLFLLSPQRIILESNKSSKSEIQSFLNTGLPLYHSQKLGDIWANLEFNKGTTHHKSIFVTDNRQGSHKQCNH